MADKDLRHAVVLAEDKPIGYVSPQHLQAQERLVREAMAAYPVLLEEHHSAREVLSNMVMHGMLTLCVVNREGNLVGTITYRSIQQALQDLYAPENSV